METRARLASLSLRFSVVLALTCRSYKGVKPKSQKDISNLRASFNGLSYRFREERKFFFPRLIGICYNLYLDLTFYKFRHPILDIQRLDDSSLEYEVHITRSINRSHLISRGFVSSGNSVYNVIDWFTVYVKGKNDPPRASASF